MHWSDPIAVSEKKEGKGKHQQLITCALDYHNEYFLEIRTVYNYGVWLSGSLLKLYNALNSSYVGISTLYNHFRL